LTETSALPAPTNA